MQHADRGRQFMTAGDIDQQYYSEVPSGGLAERALIAARGRIFRDFMAQMRPTATDRILDAGVSDIVNDGANVLERAYPFQENITACGIGAGLAFKAAFPRAGYRQIAPDNHLPFDDASFDIAASNAVLEHVGSLESQFAFVAELCRVARRVFISVPNRFFPVEHHTSIPFAHYGDAAFQLACRVTGKTDWADERNLILMSRKRLRVLAAPTGRDVAVGYTGLPLGPFSSNLYLAIR
jgi:SAM-dependent methyltransferase